MPLALATTTASTPGVTWTDAARSRLIQLAVQETRDIVTQISTQFVAQISTLLMPRIVDCVSSEMAASYEQQQRLRSQRLKVSLQAALNQLNASEEQPLRALDQDCDDEEDDAEQLERIRRRRTAGGVDRPAAEREG